MKRTGVCPKCGGSQLFTVEPALYNSFPAGFTNARIERWFCGGCGFTEEWVRDTDLEKAKRYWADSAQ